MGIIDNLFSPEDKPAIVTGGERRLGLIFAEALAKAGTDIVLCSRKEAKCEEAAQKTELKGFAR